MIEAIEVFVKKVVQRTWHRLGTCAIKPREDGAVVDGNLDVYGTRGLKVADLSLVPRIVGANTYETALVVGEKVSILVDELGLELE